MKKLLMFMSVFMIGSQIQPMSNETQSMFDGIPESLVGAGAYIGTSMFVATAINALKPNANFAPFKEETFFPSICAAAAGIMAYKGKHNESVCFGATTAGLALLTVMANK